MFNFLKKKLDREENDIEIKLLLNDIPFYSFVTSIGGVYLQIYLEINKDFHFKSNSPFDYESYYSLKDSEKDKIIVFNKMPGQSIKRQHLKYTICYNAYNNDLQIDGRRIIYKHGCEPIKIDNRFEILDL